MSETLHNYRRRQVLDQLWDELRAAVMVRWRVKGPEIDAEVARATKALVTAMENDTS